jgi:ribosomal 30S subunit maturation factor RimM
MQKLYRLAVLFFVVGFFSTMSIRIAHSQGHGTGPYLDRESNRETFDRYANEPSQEPYTDQMPDQRYTDQRSDQFRSVQQQGMPERQPSQQEQQGRWQFSQQSQPQQTRNQQGQEKQQGTQQQSAQKEREFQFKKMIGSKVTTKDGSDFGTIKDLMVDAQGRVAFVLLSHGGLWGLGDKTIAVPVETLSFNTTDQRFALNASKDELENAPTADKERISEAKVMLIYRFYGIQPYWTAESHSSGSNAH